MTSITLISPINQASKYNVRFRDGIKINKNSKVYLNYASFTRLNNARFNGNQNLNLNSNFILPTHRLDDTTLTNDLNLTAIVDTFNSDNDNFTLDSLLFEERLNTGLQSICSNQLKNYKAIDGGNVIKTNPDDKILGLSFIDETGYDDDFKDLINGTHGYGDATGGGLNEIIKKSSASATAPFYDNYTILNSSIFPFEMLNTHKKNPNENSLQKGFNFYTEEILDNITGKISVGLFSIDMMEHVNAFTGWPHKTRGSATHNGNFCNPAIFRAGQGVQLKDNDADFDTVKGASILGSFLTFEYDGTTKNFNIYMPVNPSGDTPKNWPNINQEIVGMKLIGTHDFTNDTTLLNEDATFHIQLYNDTSTNSFKTDKFRVYFKVFCGNLGDDVEKLTQIYDSFEDIEFFPLAFFNGLDVNEGGLSLAQRKARIKAQVPFCLMFSATVQNEGLIISSSWFKHDGANDKPTSILLDYNLSFSNEISKILETSKSRNLYPNTYDSLNNIKALIYSSYSSILNGLSYDVFLNNLPIKNYKNKEKSSDGGFIKQIVATCPLPFNQNNTVNVNRGSIVGLYEPNNPIKLALDNQEITLNNIDVEIKTSHDERPAFELEKAMINIIIED